MKIGIGKLKSNPISISGDTRSLIQKPCRSKSSISGFLKMKSARSMRGRSVRTRKCEKK